MTTYETALSAHRTHFNEVLTPARNAYLAATASNAKAAQDAFIAARREQDRLNAIVDKEETALYAIIDEAAATL
jgi:hypothetical protein